MAKCMGFLLIAVLVACCGCQVRSDSSHRFKKGDPVPFFANKVGPFRNPSETYAYFSLPFCSPGQLDEKKLSLGEVLSGHRLVTAPYAVEFLMKKANQLSCKKRLKAIEVSQFLDSIKNDYYAQMYIDDLPIWHFIGRYDLDKAEESRKEKYFIYMHFMFEVQHNKDCVIEANVRSDPHAVAELIEGQEIDIQFNYTVTWKETDTPFEERMKKYSQSALLPHHVAQHRSSITLSSVEVLILLGCLLVLYVRVIREDIDKYADTEELVDNHEETGWKNIHGDVFRFPEHKSLFSAALGSGAQMLTLLLLILFLGIVGVFQPYDRGVLLHALVVVYPFSSIVAGYFAVSFFCQLEGTSWVRTLLLTGVLFFGPVVLTFCLNNTIAVAYKSIAALSFDTIMLLSLVWTFVALPLLLLGGIVGKSRKSEFEAPCRTAKCQREVPRLRWYRGLLPQMALAGILPFSVVYIELYYIFASVWGHRIYTLYGVLFVVFVILLIATASVTVALTYFQLAAEDHKWWWRSFLCGGSTGLYIFAYCVYYYFERSDMQGIMQTSFFFGYMACICFGIFLMLGTVGFSASLLFVRYIYGSIKGE